mmetsp:Transcript_30273/g.98439  ORF Transcript_30273/g.98439 Transcript_30273/m.98439 type:complete len:216 (+) Transcript_30273:2731-3378(+)
MGIGFTPRLSYTAAKRCFRARNRRAPPSPFASKPPTIAAAWPPRSSASGSVNQASSPSATKRLPPRCCSAAITSNRGKRRSCDRASAPPVASPNRSRSASRSFGLSWASIESARCAHKRSSAASAVLAFETSCVMPGKPSLVGKSGVGAATINPAFMSSVSRVGPAESPLLVHGNACRSAGERATTHGARRPGTNTRPRAPYAGRSGSGPSAAAR